METERCTSKSPSRLSERWALIVGMACELTALVILGFATQGWILFALAPLFALGGIGMPALQSMTTTLVDSDRQGQLQGVLSSLVSLSSVFGPLFFSFVYFQLQGTWPGAVWLVGSAIYLLALPLMLGLLVTSIISGRVISRVGRYRMFPIAGTLTAALANAQPAGFPSKPVHLLDRKSVV